MSTETILETFHADDPRFGDTERRYVRVMSYLEGRDWKEWTRYTYRYDWMRPGDSALSEVCDTRRSVDPVGWWSVDNALEKAIDKLLQKLNVEPTKQEQHGAGQATL